MKSKECVQENKDKCIGCTRCIRVCPVSAIRLRDGKVEINRHKCISCGQCIKVCPVGAIQSVYDDFDQLLQDARFKYRVVLLSNVFIGQLPPKVDYQMATDALLSLGFDKVIDENMITGVMAPIFAQKLNEAKLRPLISSNCPAIVRLIQIKYPSLLPNILPLESSVGILSAYYRNYIAKQKGLKPEEIGIFSVAPCSAQITAFKNPVGQESSFQDGALAMRDVYNRIMHICYSQRQDEKKQAPSSGNSKRHENWGIYISEGNQVKKSNFKTLAVSGFKGAKDILSKIEGGQLDYYDYVVLRSCTNGCVGGDLNVENPFIASNRIASSDIAFEKIDKELFYKLFEQREFELKKALLPVDAAVESLSMQEKIVKMKKYEDIKKLLPGKDCGICGCPTCADLAKEIVDGRAKFSDCVFNMQEKKEMSLPEMIDLIGGKLLTKDKELSQVVVSSVYTGDLLSDVMASAGDCQVWVTIMQHQNSIAVASLLEIEAIIFAKDKVPEQSVIDKANQEGIVLISSPLTSFDISGKLYKMVVVK